MSRFQLLVLSAVVLVCGCYPHESAVCGEAPERGYRGVRGHGGHRGQRDGLRYRVLLQRRERRGVLPHHGTGILDDFEEFETDTYTIHVDPIEPGMLDSFVIYNSSCYFYDNSWMIAALTVNALLESGDEQLLYDEPEITTSYTVSEGEAYYPRSATTACESAAFPQKV